jgi:hypothetical protein
LITNSLAFFNARVTAVDTNVLPRTASITLANAILTVTNNWSVDPSVVMNFTVGASNATIAVTGSLDLDGTININAGAGFTNGTFTLFTYGNGLTWGSPTLGSVPAGCVCTLNTNTAGRVDLLVRPPPPSAPTNLAALPVSLAVSLSWSPLVSATGYNLKRSSISGGPYSVIAAGLISTNYFDAAVTNAVTYYYVVSATNSNGESADSLPANATPLPSFAPTHLDCAGDRDHLELSWAADHIGWTLQTQTNPPGVGLNTNWFTVFGSTATNRMFLPIDFTSGSVFYRLAYP